MLGWLFGIGKAGKEIGEAVSGVYGTIKGDKRQIEAGIHEEQMAVLAQFAAEFAGRPPQTWWDSLVDGLNRLPRPVITFSIMGLFVWAFYDPAAFSDYMRAMEIVPDELWMMWLTIVAFWFGGRLVSRDLRKPRLPAGAKKVVEAIARDRAEREPVPALPPVAVSPSVEAIIGDVLRKEGGYVNHPADRGGPTNYGVTQATLSAWRGRKASIDDVKNLSLAEAREIYARNYFERPGLGTLPDAIQGHILDISVHSGPARAVKLLQRALKNLGHDVAEDGQIGPVTRAAAASAVATDAKAVHNAIADARMEFLNGLVKNDPSQVAFINGWRRRVNSFRVA